MNHSCDGNTWFLEDLKMAALRDIRAGEQITYDYGLSETRLERFPRCLCGAATCRGRLSPLDYRRPDFVARYQGVQLRCASRPGRRALSRRDALSPARAAGHTTAYIRARAERERTMSAAEIAELERTAAFANPFA
jgi:hypothetical protein